MKKIIRTNNLQKALEDYDALKGQAVSYVSVLPESPDIRNSVYCKQTTTDIEDSLNITVESLIQDYAEETETADHYVIPVTYTVEYLGIAVRAIEVSGDVAIMYEDEDFTTALAASFNLEDKYLFAVTTHVTEMAYYMGDVTNQILHPVVSFGVIAEVHAKIDRVERELDAKIDSNYDLLDNKIDNSYNTLDNKIDNSYNTLDNKIVNEISNLAVNFTTNNLVANVATINNATVNNAVIDNAQVNNFDVSSIIANGSSGSDGQVLGKVNGNVEWFSPSLDTNDFKVNYLTVNNSSVTDNATINNLVVNNAILPRTVTIEVSYLDKNGQPVENRLIPQLNKLTGFGNPGITNAVYNLQFLPFITMPESEYNKSPIRKGNETWSGYGYSAYQNIMSDPVLAFVATAPVGNIYFAGKKIADANCDVKVERLAMGCARFGNGGQGSVNSVLTQSTPTASLVFTDAPVTNNFINGLGLDGKATSILGSDVFDKNSGNLPYGLDINKSSGVITTNIKNTYFIDFKGLFSYGEGMTDCFLTNPSLIVNAPSGYNVFENVTSMQTTFYQCSRFNQPVTIPNGVTSMSETFYSCDNFNQPITIPDSVTDLRDTFLYCYTLANSSVPIHISHNIALGDTTNYIYNCLVNNYTGINWTGRILNDA